METKFKIVETEEYTLAVSDEDASNSYIYFTGDPTGIFKTGIKYKSGNGNYFYQDAITGMSDTYLTTISKKIIAYKPKGNAPELDLPLLPDVEDDVKKLFEEEAKTVSFGENGKQSPFNWFKTGHKAATKVYSEEDLRKAIEMARVKDWQKDSNGDNFWDHSRDEIIQSLKQPKWFVAEIEEWLDQTYSEHGCYKQKLKITTINNKTYLVGTYLN
jgi:trehalose utilization protein